MLAGDHATPVQKIQYLYSPAALSATRSGAAADSIMMQKGVFEKPGSFLIKPHTHTYL